MVFEWSVVEASLLVYTSRRVLTRSLLSVCGHTFTADTGDSHVSMPHKSKKEKVKWTWIGMLNICIHVSVSFFLSFY